MSISGTSGSICISPEVVRSESKDVTSLSATKRYRIGDIRSRNKDNKVINHQTPATQIPSDIVASLGFHGEIVFLLY